MNDDAHSEPSAIPLIDLDRWFLGGEAERAALARDVDAHLQRLGFLVVINHRVPRAVIDECREQSRQFFHQPAEVKAAVAVTGDAYRGWVGPGLESNAATYGVATAPDLKETYAYGVVDLSDEGLRTSQPRWFAPNVWPDTPTGFRAAAEAWWRAARALSDELLDIASLALELPLHHLRDLSDVATSQVSINWYGPRGADQPLPDQFRIGPHTDFGMFTVLDREPGMGGLQVLDEHGAWIDAPVIPGSLIINTGDLLRHWTNDRWCSNEHRVLPPPVERPQEELISLVFFGEPNHDVLVEPFPVCVSSGTPAKHPPVLASDYLGTKMDALAVK